MGSDLMPIREDFSVGIFWSGRFCEKGNLREMVQRIKKTSLLLILSGFSAGLLVGVGMLIGSWVTSFQSDSEEFSFPVPLQASATDRAASFSMATGPVAEGVEGVFFLDFITGDLQCWVLYSRTGDFGAKFSVNVLNDLGITQGKKPSFLMVTGAASFPRGTGAQRPGNCVVYVADANTGNVAAYYIPWNRQLETAGRVQAAPLILLRKGQVRNLQIRD